MRPQESLFPLKRHGDVHFSKVLWSPCKQEGGGKEEKQETVVENASCLI